MTSDSNWVAEGRGGEGGWGGVKMRTLVRICDSPSTTTSDVLLPANGTAGSCYLPLEIWRRRIRLYNKTFNDGSVGKQVKIIILFLLKLEVFRGSWRTLDLMFFYADI